MNRESIIIICSVFFLVLLTFILSISAIKGNLWSVDDVRLLSEIDHISSNNKEIFFTMQTPVIQASFYSFMIQSFPNIPILVYPYFFTILLILLTAKFAYKLTNSKTISILSALTLFSFYIIIRQSFTIVAYPLAIFFGYLGLYMLHKDEKKINLPSILLSGGFISAAFHTHLIGIMFIPIPFFLIIFSKHTRKNKLKKLTLVYITILIISLPWLFFHLDINDPTGFFERDYIWLVKEDYINIINDEFWSSRITSESQDFYEIMGSLFKVFEKAIGNYWGIFIIISLLSLIYDKKIFIFLISFLLVEVILFIVINPGGFGRYLFPILPIISIAFGLSVKKISNVISNYKVRLLVIGIIVIFLTYSIIITTQNNVEDINKKTHSQLYKEIHNISQIIDDDKGVIGARPTILKVYINNNLIYSHDHLSESDYITYLLWESDEKVVKVFENNNIGWILLNNPLERWERDYHGSWLNATYGKMPEHYLKIEFSKLVEKKYEGNNFILYKLTQNEET